MSLAPRSAAALAWSLILGLTGCAVGPNFATPAAPDAALAPADLPPQTEASPVAGGESQAFTIGRDLPGEWWGLFGSPVLDTLMRQAIARYPDIAAQQAALRAARDQVRAGQGSFFPQLTGSAAPSRADISGLTVGPGYPSYITDVFQATATISYTLDVFGGTRRSVEGLRAQAEAQRFAVEASYLTLTSNVAATAIQVASVREQIQATVEVIALEERQLHLIQRQFELGSRTRAELLQQQSNLAAVRTGLPPLQQALAAAEHELAVLGGMFPSEAPDTTVALSDLTLPTNLPISLPSALVRQRPDIRAEIARVHQASAAIGVATANMLPQITLTGNVGGESLKFADLLQPASSIWQVAANITQPLFAGGTLRARRRAAIDNYDAEFARYQMVVLNAFENVADVLTSLQNDAHAVDAQHTAVDAARASLDLIERQFHSGATAYVSLLTAQQLYQQSRIAYVRALASRYTDTVALFQALGGGWWNRGDLGMGIPR